MSFEDISTLIQMAADDEKLCVALMDNVRDGILLCEKKTMRILYANEKACIFLGLNKKMRDMGVLFDSDDIEELLRGEPLYDNFTETPIQIRAKGVGEYVWVFISEYSESVESESDFNNMLEMNRELKTLLEDCSDEDIVIANENGIIEFAGQKTAEISPVPNFFIGKSVFDLERQEYFYPSVTARVLETGKSQVVVQDTKHGRHYISMGIPLFDSSGKIEKVVSFNRDYDMQLKKSNVYLNLEEFSAMQEESEEASNDNIVTCNEKMLNIKALIKMIANTDSTVLIMGETGTGKEKIARSIYNLSNRNTKPFVKVNCGTISPTIVESELFGYEPGSFTGASKDGKIGLIEAADGGVLFLDEIGELPLEQQVKLLHVLQERILVRVGGTAAIHLNIRVIAATNRNLEEQVQKGEFREDLYYRLNVVPINIPVLKERVEDIPLLVKYFLKRCNDAYGMSKQISKNAVDALCRYSWPGNIRQLENTVERLVVTTPQVLIDENNLPEEIRFEKSGALEKAVVVNEIITLEEGVELLEKQLLKMALERHKTTTKAAKALGVNQSTISRKLAQYNMN